MQDQDENKSLEDSKADAIASIAIILILVTALVFWVANQ